MCTLITQPSLTHYLKAQKLKKNIVFSYSSEQIFHSSDPVIVSVC